MDIQTRKLRAIEFLIGITDDSVLSKIELTIQKSKRSEIKSESKIKQPNHKLILERANISL